MRNWKAWQVEEETLETGWWVATVVYLQSGKRLARTGNRGVNK